MNTAAAIGGLRRDTAGATAIEYAIIAGMLSILIVAACIVIGSDLSSIFNNVATSV